MNYQESIDFLFPLHRFGIKPGLDRVLRLLETAGAPQRNLGRVFHVAGTNGKGAVACALASMFRAAGYRTALYTSPHLVSFTERMRIDGRAIDATKVGEYCSMLKKAIEVEKATFFEATTAIAFRYFSDMAVDVSVIETGMGGRLDATNVVRPESVIIPTIGLDHTGWLGETTAAIAAEKAAIIKPGARVYTGVSEPEALRPVLESAASNDCPVTILPEKGGCRVSKSGIGELEFSLIMPDCRMNGLRAPLTGGFQARNLSLAVLAARDAGLDEAAVRKGLLGIRENGYRARLERLSRRPELLVDVSHNPDGIRCSVGALMHSMDRFRKLFVVLGLAEDKDAVAVVGALKLLKPHIVTVRLSSQRGRSADTLGDACRREGVNVTVSGTAGEGLRQALRMAAPDDLVLVTGSFFLAGEVLAMMGVEI
ncbi:bifunctional folylpolyglutamate synthase/dihydrofolate synthase [Prosthecochloris sp. GSB1]|uniref:bifunctional folylpolyglutamate synthase/dihydrofolate synthase n=1 Tax=Prosthecochloris sp. GSB1 TaxID=281093 RepID=UPI000B8D15A1|nr:Mur ligase family protein [Prosthecochloris sp. GSB1]ASQ89882.1 bifunctional folylpolyglutamate synthase/dihydrofolate synthase [Prosthecochloris sp. GSB1]